MKSRFLFYYLVGICVLTGCATGVKEIALPWVYEESDQYIKLFDVLDYQGKDEGTAIPDWVHQYNYIDTKAIENLAAYYDSYAFVGINSGLNFNALMLWALSWTAYQDFNLLVLERVQARLEGFLNESSVSPLYPDYEYGAFFEKAIKAVVDAQYNEAFQDGLFWQLKRYYLNDGVTVDYEIYEFLTLNIINKKVLQEKITNIFDTLEPFSVPLTVRQAAKVSMAKEHFFDNF